MTEWFGSSHLMLHGPGMTVWVAKCCDSVMRLWLKNRISFREAELEGVGEKIPLIFCLPGKVSGGFLPALNSTTFKHLRPLMIIHNGKVGPNDSFQLA